MGLDMVDVAFPCQKKSSYTFKSFKDLEEGKKEDGDSGTDVSPPEGFDMDKFNRGRLFFRDNLFSCSVGMFFALVLGMCIPDFLQTLIFTNKSDTPQKAHLRYSNTFKHITTWHYGNVWQEGSAAQRSVLAVRKMHKNVRLEMARDGHGQFLSQYNMALVQSAFIVTPLLYSQYFGINCSKTNLDDYVYFWYGIGYLLGIDSRYNICSGGIEQAKLFCKNIQDEIVLPGLKNPSDEFYAMNNVLLKGNRYKFRGSLTVSYITTHFQKITGEKNVKFRLLDHLRCFFWTLLFVAVKHMNWLRKSLNSLIEKEFNLRFCENIF